MDKSVSIDSLIEEKVSAEVSRQMRALEDAYFAKSKQTQFTKNELAKKWGCSVVTVDRILKASDIKPIGKSGKELLFDIKQTQEAKIMYDGEVLRQHEINMKMHAMQS